MENVGDYIKNPYRISFFGGGTDFPHWYKEYGGAVLSTTIDKYCYISCRRLPPFFAHKHRFVYSIIEDVVALSDVKHPAIRGILQWLDIQEGLKSTMMAIFLRVQALDRVLHLPSGFCMY